MLTSKVADHRCSRNCSLCPPLRITGSTTSIALQTVQTRWELVVNWFRTVWASADWYRSTSSGRYVWKDVFKILWNVVIATPLSSMLVIHRRNHWNIEVIAIDGGGRSMMVSGATNDSLNAHYDNPLQPGSGLSTGHLSVISTSKQYIRAIYRHPTSPTIHIIAVKYLEARSEGIQTWNKQILSYSPPKNEIKIYI